MTRPKFADAARIALGVLDTRLNALEVKAETGTKLTQKDAELVALLTEIRAEIQRNPDERWSNHYPG